MLKDGKEKPKTGMIEPCTECGELAVIRKDNGVIECAKCGTTLYTPKELQSMIS